MRESFLDGRDFILERADFLLLLFAKAVILFAQRIERVDAEGFLHLFLELGAVAVELAQLRFRLDLLLLERLVSTLELLEAFNLIIGHSDSLQPVLIAVYSYVGIMSTLPTNLSFRFRHKVNYEQTFEKSFVLPFSVIKNMIAVIIANASLYLAMATGAAAQASGGAIDACTGDTLGGMFCVAQRSSVTSILILIGILCFICGMFLAYKSLTELMQISDSGGGLSQQGGVTTPLLKLAAATFLVALPATIAVGIGSLGNGMGAWSPSIQDDVGAPGAVGGDDFLSMVGSFAVNAAGPLSTLVMGVAVIIGVVLVATSLFGMARMNSPQSRDSFGSVAGKFFIGIGLVNIFWLMRIIAESFGLPSQATDFFPNITSQAISYSDAITDQSNSGSFGESGSLGGSMENMISLAFMALIPFGLIAFVRGLLIIKDTIDQSQQASVGAGVTHVFGGVALVNAEAVSCAIMRTLAGGASFCPT